MKQAQKLNRVVVRDYFNKLKETLTQHDVIDKPERIFNVDEKGCQLSLHHQPQAPSERGKNRVMFEEKSIEKMSP